MSLPLKRKYPLHTCRSHCTLLDLIMFPSEQASNHRPSVGILTHKPLRLFLMQSVNWIIIVRPLRLWPCNYTANILGQRLQRRGSTRNYYVAVMANKGWTGAMRRFCPAFHPSRGLYAFRNSNRNIIDKGWRFFTTVRSPVMIEAVAAWRRNGQPIAGSCRLRLVASWVAQSSDDGEEQPKRNHIWWNGLRRRRYKSLRIVAC